MLLCPPNIFWNRVQPNLHYCIDKNKIFELLSIKWLLSKINFCLELLLPTTLKIWKKTIAMTNVECTAKINFEIWPFWSKSVRFPPKIALRFYFTHCVHYKYIICCLWYRKKLTGGARHRSGTKSLLSTTAVYTYRSFFSFVWRSKLFISSIPQ